MEAQYPMYDNQILTSDEDTADTDALDSPRYPRVYAGSSIRQPPLPFQPESGRHNVTYLETDQAVIPPRPSAGTDPNLLGVGSSFPNEEQWWHMDPTSRSFAPLYPQPPPTESQFVLDLSDITPNVFPPAPQRHFPVTQFGSDSSRPWRPSSVLEVAFDHCYHPASGLTGILGGGGHSGPFLNEASAPLGFPPPHAYPQNPLIEDGFGSQHEQLGLHARPTASSSNTTPEPFARQSRPVSFPSGSPSSQLSIVPYNPPSKNGSRTSKHIAIRRKPHATLREKPIIGSDGSLQGTLLTLGNRSKTQGPRSPSQREETNIARKFGVCPKCKHSKRKACSLSSCNPCVESSTPLTFPIVRPIQDGEPICSLYIMHKETLQQNSSATLPQGEIGRD